ncbi:MAG: ATP-binding cassette domain-containing protein [Planctomycetes bacterium]|nr:ATP-binding cassette domain-containing protein [Planctomycetota bacterium]
MPEPVIDIQNLSVSYKIYSHPFDLIKEVFVRKPCHDLFWALRDVSFAVQEKQRVGIIGPNGAGKSTLLKVISQNLQPTSGNIQVNGKISAMLCLASSLNPDEDGISNIRFNLMMNGCDPKDIPRLTEEIIEFTELGPFIYSPVKTYSSGMNARLAFAITTAMKPEILIVDEILSVGDGYFVGKAIKRMIKLCEMGRALVFVSHSLADIRNLCDTAVWMENGTVRMIGPVEEVCNEYQEDYQKKRDLSEREENIERHKQARAQVAGIDLEERHTLYLRIVTSREKRDLHDVHYVRDIELCLNEETCINVPLEATSVDQPVEAKLDVINSEWGRVYSRRSHECRLLCANSGKNMGGLISFNIPPHESDRKELPITLSFLYDSHGKDETLVVEYFDYSDTQWKSCEHKDINQDDAWCRVSACCNMMLPNDEAFQKAKDMIELATKHDMEIVDIFVEVNGRRTHVIQEQCPFTVAVRVKANRKIPLADVFINIYSISGQYVFYQSSGLNPSDVYDTSCNFHDFEGEATVRFMFEVNPFRSDEYSISAWCANGFDPVNNYPQSCHYDVQVNGTSFVVTREYDDVPIDYGWANIRVPVQIEMHTEE